MTTIKPNSAEFVRNEWNKALKDDGKISPTEYKQMLVAILNNDVSHDELQEAQKIFDELNEPAQMARFKARVLKDVPAAQAEADIATNKADAAEKLFWSLAKARFDRGFLVALLTDLNAAISKATPEK